ncbi:MAG: LamG-like jellyroll fold domain-containing protein [Thermoanaerobaculia bacterium]
MKSTTSLVVLLAVALAASACQAERPEPPVEDPVGGVETGTDSSRSSLGDGFVVWESNRSGSWRLWSRDLDESPPRQLTPDEGPRLHCCPHISPDGRWIAYLSLAADQQGYPQGGAHGALRRIRPDGTGDQLLLPDARNYYENRAVVWRSTDELIFIDSDQRTALLNLDSGAVTLLTNTPSERYPWLINSHLRFATSGRVSFAPFDKAQRKVLERSPIGGCQPYFSHDGKWGFWLAAPGGPIHKIELATGVVEALLKKSDPRLAKDFGYLYFPMISADGRALAFAASRNEHPHFKADYEVFVAPTEPTTLRLLGAPMRITTHPSTDRYPDVYLEPLGLGLHRGEAPLTVQLAPPGEPRTYNWTWGDGNESQGESAEYTFERPGVFVITATTDDSALLGRAIVEQPRAPHVTKSQVYHSGTEVTLRFDEPIDVEGATWVLKSGVTVRSVEQLDDDRELLLRLDGPLQNMDELVIEGVRDRAANPNLMPSTSLDLVPASWPVDRDGLILMWESGNSANLVIHGDKGVEEAVILQAHGRARLDRDWALTPNGGQFTVSKELANRLRWACQATNELTVEAVIEPQPSDQRRGVVLGMAKGAMNFVLSQQGSTLLIALRVKSRGPDAAPEVRALDLPPSTKSHIAVTYSAGRLAAYLDGEEAISTGDIQGGFFHWQTLPVTMGSDAHGRSTWHGTLEGIAIYNRVLSAEEIRENAARQRRRLDARSEVPSWTLVVERTACSTVPTLEEIAPYREALAVCEYRVLETLSGEYDHPLARVAQWVIQDGKRTPLSPASEGRGDPVIVERFQDNPQLESLFLSETLAARPDLPLLYLVGESRRR